MNASEEDNYTEGPHTPLAIEDRHTPGRYCIPCGGYNLQSIIQLLETDRPACTPRTAYSTHRVDLQCRARDSFGYIFDLYLTFEDPHGVRYDEFLWKSYNKTFLLEGRYFAPQTDATNGTSSIRVTEPYLTKISNNLEPASINVMSKLLTLETLSLIDSVQIRENFNYGDFIDWNEDGTCSRFDYEEFIGDGLYRVTIKCRCLDSAGNPFRLRTDYLLDSKFEFYKLLDTVKEGKFYYLRGRYSITPHDKQLTLYNPTYRLVSPTTHEEFTEDEIRKKFEFQCPK